MLRLTLVRHVLSKRKTHYRNYYQEHNISNHRRYHPWGFRAPYLGHVEAHTTFTLRFNAEDIDRLSEGLGASAAVDSQCRSASADGVVSTDATAWHLSPTGVSPPNISGAVLRADDASEVKIRPSGEEDAWELVAREVLLVDATTDCGAVSKCGRISWEANTGWAIISVRVPRR